MEDWESALGEVKREDGSEGGRATRAAERNYWKENVVRDSAPSGCQGEARSARVLCRLAGKAESLSSMREINPLAGDGSC
jgi:hypothetical protein